MVYKTLLLHFISFLGAALSAQTIYPYHVTAATGAPAGYYFLSPAKINAAPGTFPPLHIILDSRGQVAYFRWFKGGNSDDFKLHPNGLMSYSYNGRFYLMDSTFTVIDSVSSQNGIAFDAHDIQLLGNGHILWLGTETITMNLSAYHFFGAGHINAGSDTAHVKCGVIQELDAGRQVVFEWHARNYYPFDDVDSSYLASPVNVDWTHFNSVGLDDDGNLLVSVRHFNEVAKISRADSSIIWRLGGKHSQFTFANNAQAFIGQHDARRIANGNLTLLDNGTAQHPATAKEYSLDMQAMTASLVWSYTESSNLYSRSTGNVQRLPSGQTLIDYGNLNAGDIMFNVVDSAGNKVFEITTDDTLYSYRAFNYAQLPFTLSRPQISCYESNGQYYLDAGAGYSAYQWMDGTTTQTIMVSGPGNYWVAVPYGAGYVRSEVTITNPANACNTNALSETGRAFFTCYPNPVDGNVAIDMAEPAGRNTMLEICDIHGQKVFSQPVEPVSHTTVSMQGLPAGVYMVSCGGHYQKLVKL